MLLTADQAQVIVSDAIVHGGVTGVSFAPVGDGALYTINRGGVSGDEFAITAAGGDDHVSNYGTVRGNVDLGTGTDVFANLETGRVESRATFVAASFQNSGIPTPGGLGAVQRTSFTGNVSQSNVGRFAVDLIGDGSTVEADRIDIREKRAARRNGRRLCDGRSRKVRLGRARVRWRRSHERPGQGRKQRRLSLQAFDHTRRHRLFDAELALRCVRRRHVQRRRPERFAKPAADGWPPRSAG